MPTERFTCPTCGVAVALDDAHRPDSFPFCSQRCRLQDLNAWLDGRHAIPGTTSPDGMTFDPPV